MPAAVAMRKWSVRSIPCSIIPAKKFHFSLFALSCWMESLEGVELIAHHLHLGERRDIVIALATSDRIPPRSHPKAEPTLLLCPLLFRCERTLVRSGFQISLLRPYGHFWISRFYFLY